MSNSIQKMTWTEEKILYLKDNYSIMSAKELSVTLSCSEKAIFMKAYKLGLKGRDNGSWNLGKIVILDDKEIKILKQNYHKGPKYCSNLLNKKYSSIIKIANKLGLKANTKDVITNNLDVLLQRQKHQKRTLQKYNEQNKLFKNRKEINEVIALYKSGLSSIEIAKKFECSKPTILKILKDTPKRKSTDYSHHHSKTQGCGKKHHSWKGGYKSIYDRFRDLTSYWNWRNAVLKRDESKCQNCNSTNTLEVHHKITIKMLIDSYCSTNKILPEDFTNKDLNNKYFYDIDNGLTLCKECHKEHHRLHGR